MDVIFAILTALVLVLIVIKISSEQFQRVSYTDLQDIMEHRYESDRPLTHPIALQPPVSSTYPTDIPLRVNLHPLRPQSFQKSSNVMFPEYTRGRNVNQSHRYNNNPVLYGYLKSQDDSDNELYELYEMYDHKRGRNGYVYKDSKYENNRESVYVTIDHTSYNGDTLYTGDTLSLGYNNKIFIVQEYEYKNRGVGTRYNDLDIRDAMEGYGILRPLSSANNHDVVREEDRFFILYRQEVDRHRGTFYYYIKDKRDVIIQLDKNVYKDLYDGDLVTVPGKEKYGQYTLSVYDDIW